jgi:hypothetical protein
MLTTDTIAAGQSGAQGPDRVRVAVPCYKKEAAIADVVRAFRPELLDSVVYVYDNNSTDTATDRLSGCRAFSRRFVKSFPVLSAR